MDFRIWNTGGPDVTIVTWEMPELTGTYTATGYPTGDLVLEKSGKVVTVKWRMEPKVQPLKVKPEDPLTLTRVLSNGIKKHFKTKVT